MWVCEGELGREGEKERGRKRGGEREGEKERGRRSGEKERGREGERRERERGRDETKGRDGSLTRTAADQEANHDDDCTADSSHPLIRHVIKSLYTRPMMSCQVIGC